MSADPRDVETAEKIIPCSRLHNCGYGCHDEKCTARLRPAVIELLTAARLSGWEEAAKWHDGQAADMNKPGLIAHIDAAAALRRQALQRTGE